MNAPTSLHPTDQTLSSYGLGKLDDILAEAINKHLEQCPDCRKRVAELSADSFLGRIRDAQAGKSTFDVSQTGGRQSDKRSSAPPPKDTMPPGLADHPDYEIKRELGRGGMGVVYLAHNKLMGRDEVLKVMGRQIMERPGVLDRFLREIRAVAKLRHPNIVTAYSAVRLGESIVFAMEYVEGLDLSKIIKTKGPLPVAHACNFVYQSALGLQHAHDEGLVHRDIKPGNLMLSRKKDKSTVKVLDFGLAKVTREEKVDLRLTSEGQALGTPDYIAPEQIIDAPSADIRADIYSLGGTLYHLLTGRPPFQASSLYDMFQAHMSREADPLNFVRPEVPAELAALVAKMMAKDPARRFQSPGEVAEALTPFFKKGNVAFTGTKPEISRDGQMVAGRPETGTVSTPTQRTTNAGSPVVRTKKMTEPAVPESQWESLIEFRETERSVDEAPKVGPTRRPPWKKWPIVLAGSLFGLIALGIIIITIRDKTGRETKITVPDDSSVVVEKPPGNVESTSIAGGADTPGEGNREGPRPGNAPATGSGFDPASSGDPDLPRFVSLFNGRDLAGWKTHGSGPGSWNVQDGVLIGTSTAQLFSERGDFKDFHLRVEARFGADGHGGIGFRSPMGEVAYEALINSTRGDRGLSGSVYRQDIDKVIGIWGVKPAAPGQWFTLEVIAEGDLIFTKVNGRPTAYHVASEQWRGAQPGLNREGHLALLRQGSGKMEFRKIEIRPLQNPAPKGPNELVRLEGHTDRVSRIAFSPDGRSILSGGSGHTLDYTETGTRSHTGGEDNTVRLWDVTTGRNLIQTPSLKWDVIAVAFSRDGGFGASSSGWGGATTNTGEKIISVWDLSSGRRIHRFERDQVKLTPPAAPLPSPRTAAGSSLPTRTAKFAPGR